MNGIINAIIGGKSRSLKFGTNSTAKYCEVRGCTLDEYIQDMTLTQMRGDEIRDLIYSGLWAYAMSNKEPFEDTRFDVGDWIDDAEQEEINGIFQALASSNAQKVEGNGKKESKKK